MSAEKLIGNVTGVKRLDAARVSVSVEFADPRVPEDKRVDGSVQELEVPMPIEKAKSMGIGALVEITIKKLSTRKKAEEKVETKDAAGDEPTEVSDEEGQENDDPEPPKQAAPQPTGRRRAANTPAA